MNTTNQNELRLSSFEIESLNDYDRGSEHGKISDWMFVKAKRHREQQEHHQSPPNQRTHQARLDRHADRRASRKLAQHNLGHPSRRLIFNQLSPLIALVLIAIHTASYVPASEGVDCFKCSSRNGSNPACEDPFHNLNTTRVMSPILPEPHPNVIYHTPCYAGKKGRDGLFPASACIKLTGVFARMSHCGKFQFEGDLLRGCVLACPEDACNSAFSTNNPTEMLSLIVWLCTITSACFACRRRRRSEIIY